MVNNKSIGLFFGSFNPIHSGHLIIANYMLEFTALNEIWFVVSPQNPLKERKSLLADYHRLEMVNIAIENNAQMKSCNIEFKLSKPSYTIDTLKFLKEKYPKKDFVLIMGADSLESLRKWKNFRQLLEFYEIYVYPRPGSDGGEFITHPRVTKVNSPLIEISSSFIRKAIKEKKNIDYFLPEKVYEYIKEMHFYETPSFTK